MSFIIVYHSSFQLENLFNEFGGYTQRMGHTYYSLRILVDRYYKIYISENFLPFMHLICCRKCALLWCMRFVFASDYMIHPSICQFKYKFCQIAYELRVNNLCMCLCMSTVCLRINKFKLNFDVMLEYRTASNMYILQCTHM